MRSVYLWIVLIELTAWMLLSGILPLRKEMIAVDLVVLLLWTCYGQVRIPHALMDYCRRNVVSLSTSRCITLGIAAGVWISRVFKLILT